jgi:hypothetical protein
MPSDEAERYTLLWDAAAEMACSNEQLLERNWLRLIDAFWRGDLASDGLTYFYPAPPAGREFVVLRRDALAGMLLGHRAVDTEAVPIDDLRHWRTADYENQSAPCGYFRRDPEGRLGLAVLATELDRWRCDSSRTADRVIRSEDKRIDDDSNRRGAYRGALDSWMAKQNLSVLQRMEPAGIAREFKAYCDQELPGLIRLLPKRLRSMEGAIERIIKRRVEAQRTQNRSAKAIGNGQ